VLVRVSGRKLVERSQNWLALDRQVRPSERWLEASQFPLLDWAPKLRQSQFCVEELHQRRSLRTLQRCAKLA
jgi:hypothetical protein